MICAVPDQHEQVVPGIDAIFETSFDFNQPAVSDVGMLKKPPTPQSVGALLGEWQGFESAFATQTPPEETIFDAVRNATADALHRTPEPAASVRPIVPSTPAAIALSPPMEFEEEDAKRSITPSPTQAALARVWDSTAEAAVAAGSPADPGYGSPARSEQPEPKPTTTRSGRRVKVRVKIDASPEPDEAAPAPARRRPAAAAKAAWGGGGGGGPVRNRAMVRARHEAAQARSSPLPIPNDGVLPLDHRPARGRGRQQQLKRMTQEQREAEAAARLEKNRVAARECRVRRKEHLSELQDQVSEYEARDLEQRQLIAQLNAEVAALRAEVAARC